MPARPAGYNAASPYLIVTSAEATLAFLEKTFGATRLRIIAAEGGRIAHAEVKVDDTVIMMGEAPDAVPAHVHVYVDDPDAAFARAEAAGGIVVQPMEDKPDGDRRGGIADPNGIVWWIAKQIG
jgi:uncharacterized glyoxalase superfamily protein PhnB